jgi:hypothetical protein
LEPVSDINVSLLGLLDGSDLASSDSPNGLVGNDDVPVRLVHGVEIQQNLLKDKT